MGSLNSACVVVTSAGRNDSNGTVGARHTVARWRRPVTAGHHASALFATRRASRWRASCVRRRFDDVHPDASAGRSRRAPTGGRHGLTGIGRADLPISCRRSVFGAHGISLPGLRIPAGIHVALIVQQCHAQITHLRAHPGRSEPTAWWCVIVPPGGHDRIRTPPSWRPATARSIASCPATTVKYNDAPVGYTCDTWYHQRRCTRCGQQVVSAFWSRRPFSIGVLDHRGGLEGLQSAPAANRESRRRAGAANSGRPKAGPSLQRAASGRQQRARLGACSVCSCASTVIPNSRR